MQLNSARTLKSARHWHVLRFPVARIMRDLMVSRMMKIGAWPVVLHGTWSSYLSKRRVVRRGVADDMIALVITVLLVGVHHSKSAPDTP